MDIEETRQGDVVILTPEGGLGPPAACAALERKLNALLEAQARRVVVDCRKVDQVASAAIRVLLQAKRKLLSVQGELVLCELTSQVRMAFSISHFDRDFTVVDSREQAVAKAGGTGVAQVAELAVRLLAAAPGPVAGWSDGRDAPVPDAFCERMLAVLAAADAATRGAQP